MAAYACGTTSYRHAVESAICYLGMCKHCNGQNMRRWIENNFVLKRNEDYMSENELPPKARHFYNIHRNQDGTVDVYLRPEVLPMSLDTGETDFDIAVLVVKDVPLTEDLEENIRAHYEDWCASAEVIYL